MGFYGLYRGCIGLYGLCRVQGLGFRFRAFNELGIRVWAFRVEGLGI